MNATEQGNGVYMNPLHSIRAVGQVLSPTVHWNHHDPPCVCLWEIIYARNVRRKTMCSGQTWECALWRPEIFAGQARIMLDSFCEILTKRRGWRKNWSPTRLWWFTGWKTPTKQSRIRRNSKHDSRRYPSRAQVSMRNPAWIERRNRAAIVPGKAKVSVNYKKKNRS